MQKTKRYWLRGGIIFAIIFLPIFWINDNNGWDLLLLILLWYILGFYYTTNLSYFLVTQFFPNVSDNLTSTQRWFGGLIIFLMYVIIGIVLGWLYGKIRSRKQ